MIKNSQRQRYNIPPRGINQGVLCQFSNWHSILNKGLVIENGILVLCANLQTGTLEDIGVIFDANMYIFITF